MKKRMHVFLLFVCYLFIFGLACMKPKEETIICNGQVQSEQENKDDTNISQATPTEEPTATPKLSKTASGFKAVWLSQFDMQSIYTVSGRQRSQSDYKTRIQEVVQNIKSCGFNTIILQVRPYADSMYPSKYFPMSKYATGDYGKVASYDPVEIIIEIAHKADLEIHAWINPMRAMTESEIKLIAPDYKIRKWYDDSSLNGTYLILLNGRYYFNPAYEEVRQLIVDGAKEALTLYDFDGLHMDDYFYPTTDTSFDAISYAEYTQNGGTKNLGEYRRNNINALVKALYNATKEVGNDLIYGISPAGNLNTVYNSQYADVYTWCSKSGYIDYLCPQVYFGMEHQNYDFVKVCNMYQDIIKTNSVDLMIGMTLGKAFDEKDAYAGTGKYEWRDQKDILKRCIVYTKELKRCAGIAMFSYQYLFDPTTGNAIEKTRAEVENFVPVLFETKY